LGCGGRRRDFMKRGSWNSFDEAYWTCRSGIGADDFRNIRLGHILVQIIVDQTDGSGTATCQTFDEFDAVFSIGTGRQTMMMIGGGIDADGLAKLFTKLITARHGTRESSTDADNGLAWCLLAKPGIEGDEFEDIDRFQGELAGDPVYAAIVDETEVILPEVEQRERGAPFGHRVVRHRLVDFGKKLVWNLVCLSGTRGRYWMMCHEVMEQTKNSPFRKEGNRFQ